MKLNKKGYMLVEIVVAAVLAMSIAYYLLNLTYKFKNTNEDLIQSYIYAKEKIMITKNIMSDIEKGTVSPINLIDTEDTKTIDFEYLPKGSDESTGNIEYRRLKIVKNNTNKTTIEYGKLIDDEFDVNDVSYYKKELSAGLIAKEIIIEPEAPELSEYNMSVIIPIKSIYDNNDYSIKLFFYIKDLEVSHT